MVGGLVGPLVSKVWTIVVSVVEGLDSAIYKFDR